MAYMAPHRPVSSAVPVLPVQHHGWGQPPSQGLALNFMVTFTVGFMLGLMGESAAGGVVHVRVGAGTVNTGAALVLRPSIGIGCCAGPGWLNMGLHVVQAEEGC
mmetsp:Transcript_23263/g.59431  ORF Transcript_23263/g.59431 Transcript_23263/m.59431 type:complete len:104 (+) Transcript_23263:1427-1738(+)